MSKEKGYGSSGNNFDVWSNPIGHLQEIDARNRTCLHAYMSRDLETFYKAYSTLLACVSGDLTKKEYEAFEKDMYELETEMKKIPLRSRNNTHATINNEKKDKLFKKLNTEYVKLQRAIHQKGLVFNKSIDPRNIWLEG